MLTRLLSGLLALVLTGAATFAQTPAPASPSPRPTPPSVTLPADIERVLRDYEARFAARDAKGLSALFVEDGWVLAPGRPPVRGRTAIAAHYGSSGGPLALRALAWDAAGETGYVIGAYASKAGAPDDGKFTLTLRKVDGRWLIVSDMDNGNHGR